MSYCRFAWGGSDVYVYPSSQGIECCGCRFGTNFTSGTPEEMIAHLALHRRAGHYVPASAIMELWEDVPGTSIPVNPEPSTMTVASLRMAASMLHHRADQIEHKGKEPDEHAK